MIRIADGIYLETRFKEGNLGLIETEEGMLLIDAPANPKDVSPWQHQVAEVGKKSPIYLINTDHHPLRIMSNELLDIPKIAHQAALKEFNSPRSAYRQHFKEIYRKYHDEEAPDSFERFMPTLTFSKRMNLYKGGRQIRFIASGGATSASIIVHLPKEKVVFTGALVVTGTHPDLTLASSHRWLETLTYLKRLSVEVIVPGYGEPCGKEAVDEVAEYIRMARKAVQELCNAGKSRSEVAKLVNDFLPLRPVPSHLRGEMRNIVKAGLSRLYEEFKGGNP